MFNILQVEARETLCWRTQTWLESQYIPYIFKAGKHINNEKQPRASIPNDCKAQRLSKAYWSYLIFVIPVTNISYHNGTNQKCRCMFGCSCVLLCIHGFQLCMYCCVLLCVEELGQEFVQLVQSHKTTRRGIGISLDNSQGFNMCTTYILYLYYKQHIYFSIIMKETWCTLPPITFKYIYLNVIGGRVPQVSWFSWNENYEWICWSGQLSFHLYFASSLCESSRASFLIGSHS